MICAKCGTQMHQTDKNTMTGRVIREYECGNCGHSDWVDEGVALWQVLHDAREQDEAEAAARVTPNAQAARPAAVSPSQNPRTSLGQRLTRLFRGKK
jgi:DNA-directed RNA polymerase subunit M/transcription elongation factor TFIIS